jgi:hypothetical protein
MCGCNPPRALLIGSRRSSQQLGEVHRYPPRLVARQPIGRRAVRRSNMSGIGGKAEVRGFHSVCRFNAIF